jgi:ATP-dependent Clp protease adaptor protein ClpS
MAEKGTDYQPGQGVLEKVREELKKPDMYKVVLHNDDYTTKLFVIEVLQVVFHKPIPEATRIMLHVHRNGRGVVGVYTWDIAQTKVSQVHQLAKDKEYPLRCTVEKD